MNFKQIKGLTNVFINEDSGILFTVKNGKDVPFPTQPFSHKPIVNINGKSYKLLDLLLATYDFPLSDTDNITYKVNKSGFISPKSIKIRSFGNISNEDDRICLEYKCGIKASSANTRFRDKISKGNILQLLRLSEFKCVYCGCDINPDNWHLDHVHPKAFGGTNVPENLAPSCDVCNKMKGALDGINFIKRCRNICLNNRYLSREESAGVKQQINTHNKNRQFIGDITKPVRMRNAAIKKNLAEKQTM